MAEHLFLGCPVCGASRPLERFGISAEGEFDQGEASSHLLKLSRKFTGGGNKGIRWTHEAVPHEYLVALREHIQDVLESIDAHLAIDGDVQIRCITCGTFESPLAFGIEGKRYDDASAPFYDSAVARPHFSEDRQATWVSSDIPMDLMLALLARLEASVEQAHRDIDAGGR